jgi:hypothetical protein
VDTVAALVNCAMPRVSLCSTRVVRALIASRGVTGHAHAFARSVGLRNRDQLRRVLAADGLPCLEDLAGWIRVLGWLIDAETSGVALSRGALWAGKDPTSCYRTVKRLTGASWGEVRLRGSTWLLLQLTGAIRRSERRSRLRQSSSA